MAVKIPTSSKRLAISQANARMIAIVAAASVLSIFCLVGAKALWIQNAYQAKVNAAKDKAHHQLQDNLKAADKLEQSYQRFNAGEINKIGGKTNGTGDNDGDNAKIIRDSLPDTYDFPALTSSIEKIMKDRQYQITAFTGTDDQVNQASKATSSTPTPQPIPFSFTVSKANYAAAEGAVKTLELSIRPIQVDNIAITGGTDNIEIVIGAHTYYQPQKSLKIKSQVVK